MQADGATAAWTPQGPGLTEARPGFWTAQVAESLSYPADGNALCFQVEATSFWFNHRNRCVLSTAQRLAPPGPFADVGGGNGFVARALMEAGLNILLIEPGMRGALNAWQRGVRPVVCARLESAGIARGSLGGVGLFDVIEHIEDDVSFLAQARRFLKPGGRVYVTVPAFAALWSHEDEYAGHFRRYSPATLRAALSSAGFEIEYLTAMFYWLPLPVFLLRSLPARLGRRAASADRTRQEHRLPGGIAGAVISKMLNVEAETIARGGTLSIGGSLLAVGRVPD